MARRDEYRDHLSSQAWADLRKMVFGRSRGVCEVCEKATATQVHHVRYPKVFSDDHPDNLLALCDACHKKQHGIRIEKMRNDLIASAPRQTFIFGGRDQEYPFEFVMINGRPWLQIGEVERVLYREDRDRGDCVTNLNGRALEMHAAAHLTADHRFVSDSGVTWLSASGTFQTLMKREEQACISFREQLGGWLEQQVVELHNKMQQQQQAIGESSRSVGGGLSALKAIVSELEAHEARIQEATATADSAKQIAESTKQMIENVLEIGYSLAADFLAKRAPHLASANKDASKGFGAFLAKAAKNAGAKKGYSGWVHPDGRVLSKRVPSPSTQYSELNKWSESWMDQCLPLYQRNINPPSRGITASQWADIVKRMQLSGIANQILLNSTFVRATDDRVTLELLASAEHLRSPGAESRIYDALRAVTGKNIKIDIVVRRP